MVEFQKLGMNVLMDLLSLHTARYTRMMMEGGNKEDFTNCKKTIEELQQEIRFRNVECDITGSAVPLPPLSHQQL